MNKIKNNHSIFYIANARLPTEKAHGYQILQMCQAFQENEANVELLLPSRLNTKELKSKKITDYYGLRRNIPNYKLPSWDLLPFFTTKHPQLARFAFFANLINTFTFGKSLVRFFRDLFPLSKLPLIYTRDLNISALLQKKLPAPLKNYLVVEVHSLSARPWRRRRQARILQKALAVVCMTQTMREQLAKLNVSRQKMLFAPDGVDLQSFDINIKKTEARRNLQLSEKGLIASYIGKFHTLGEEKGIVDIIRSSKYLLADFPELKFYFIGGPLDRVPGYNKIISQEKLLRSHFIFMDKQPIQKVPFYLKAADILLMPHPWSEFYAYHVSPLKMFEYMSSKRPIVASKLPAICEILKDGKNALLGDPGNPESIAINIGKLLKDPQLAARLAEKAYEDVQEHTWQKRAKRIIQFIQERLKYSENRS